MGKYIIEIDDGRNILRNCRKTMLAISMAIGKTEGSINTGIELTPYTEPDMELLTDEAHEIGFSEGYEQGVKQGRKEMREAVIKLADVSKRICAFDGGSIEYIFRTYKPETILGELELFDKQKFDKDLSTLVEQYGCDGVTEVLRKMIESEKE